MKIKEISVVLLTYNAEKYIRKLIQSLLNQSIKTELIIIDSSSEDMTIDILKEFKISYIQIAKEEFNHGKTRNLGISLSNNEIVVFITQDALPISNDSLETLVKPFETDNKIGIIFGRQKPYPETDIFGSFARIYNYPKDSYERSYESIENYGIKTYFNSNSYSSYRKSILLKYDGFPERIIMCEDSFIAARLILNGFKIRYNANSIVYHSHTYSLTQEFKRYFDIGVAYGSNSWMLTKFKGNKNQGYEYFLAEYKFLIQKSKQLLLPKQILRTILKLIAYRLGKSHQMIPKSIIKKLSLHNKYWT
jgi:rhamnosyltransferase